MVGTVPLWISTLPEARMARHSTFRAVHQKYLIQAGMHPFGLRPIPFSRHRVTRQQAQYEPLLGIVISQRRREFVGSAYAQFGEIRDLTQVVRPGRKRPCPIRILPYGQRC